jgi:RimJ/RimL family protein N-acetyltransferase
MSEGSFTVTIPRLETDRLVLREPRAPDFEPFAVSAADAEARVYIGGPIDRREAWRRFLSLGGGWVVNGVGWWVVEQRERGVVVGSVGIFRREGDPVLELGCAMHRPYWGFGYATEAAKAALDHAMASLGDRVIAYVAVENVASHALATKLGMRREAEVVFLETKCIRYALGREA